MKLNIVNEDGTPLDIPNSDIFNVDCSGYGCLWCNKCPVGEFYKETEEEKDYHKKMLEYDKLHNPTIYKILVKSRKSL